MYFVYVLFSPKIGKYYTGHSADVRVRLEQHNNSIRGWSSRGKPWKLVYTEEYSTRSDAMKREKFLKSGKGREFLKSCITDNPSNA